MHLFHGLFRPRFAVEAEQISSRPRRLSLSPRFIGVIVHRGSGMNRFSGFPYFFCDTWAPKTAEAVMESWRTSHTLLKQGVNENSPGGHLGLAYTSFPDSAEYSPIRRFISHTLFCRICRGFG
jgi:hypothetical protein